ncbi:hypothetical protein QUB33_05490 [Microcoleus sp. B3-A4]|uniref:hypothetical protein n=1 Tax=Microcoleus sp. B3-A4 TaxID=2818653 RepID=UPI002FD646F0
MHNPDFSIPQEVEKKLRICLVIEEASWINPEGELVPCEVNHEVVAPQFLPGKAEKLICFSRQKYVTIGLTPIKLFLNKDSAWESACLDAVSELGLSNTQIISKSIVTQVINKATLLIQSLNWWMI